MNLELYRLLHQDFAHKQYLRPSLWQRLVMWWKR